MNKLLTKIATFGLGMIMAIGVGVAAVTSDGFTRASAATTYEKASNISVGDTVLLVCESKKMELSSISSYGVGAPYSTNPEGTYPLTVESGSTSGTFSFKTPNGQYLYWTSGNSLATNATKSANSSWKVTFSNSNLTIANANDNARKLQWNANSPRFACYTSSQTAVQLFKLSEGGNSSGSGSDSESETPVVPDTGGTWNLVSDASTLKAEDKIIIAAKDYDYAISTTQNSNNRGQASIIKNGNSINPSDYVQILTLKAGTISNTYGLYTGSGYLYASSSSANQLKTQGTNNANGSWKITITSGTTSIVAQGSSTRNVMQYNQPSSLFACYSSASQKALAIYKFEEPIDVLESIVVNNPKTNFKQGDLFVFGGTATATYASGTKTIDNSKLTFKIGDSFITTSTKLTVANHNNQNVTVSYTDENEETASTSYNISVSYKDIENIQLNITEYTLGIDGTLELEATLIGSDYDPNTVIQWSTSEEAVAIVEASGNQATVTAKGNGTATITATAGAKSATCVVTVASEPSLVLLDENEAVLEETYNKFTEDDKFYIEARTENIQNPTYVWEANVENVIKIEVDEIQGNISYINFVGEGTAILTLTVGELTESVTFIVTQSCVTSLTLDSSEDDGVIYLDGSDKTFTLTPTINTVGNASKEIEWSTSVDGVVSLSSTLTNGSESNIVTAKAEGEVIITATSKADNTYSVDYTLTVYNRTVSKFSWTEHNKDVVALRGQTLNEAYGGDFGKFSAEWNDETKESNLSVGTGEGNVHLYLLDNDNYLIDEPNTGALSLDYVLKAEDDGLRLVAFYYGKRANSYAYDVIKVKNWRDVIINDEQVLDYKFVTADSDSNTEFKEDTFAEYFKASKTTSSNSLAVPSISGSKMYKGKEGLKGGSGSAKGTLTISFDPNIAISRIVISAKSYRNDTSSLIIAGTTYQLSTTFEEINISFDSNKTNSFSIEAKNVQDCRYYIESLQIYTGGEMNIGNSEDCIGLHDFIETYMHMDYVENEGLCLGDEGYYALAEAAFIELNPHQKELFSTHSAYSAEWERLQAWANANGEKFDPQTGYFTSKAQYLILGVEGNNPQTVITLIVSAIVIASTVFAIYYKKREENAR